MLIAPGAFDQNAARPPVAGLGDRAMLDRIAGRSLRRHQTEIGHQLGRGLEARQITDLAQQCGRRDQVDAAHRHQRGDHRGQRPVRHRGADRLLQSLDALLRLAHRQQHLLERDALLGVVELLARQPVHMRLAPGALARIQPSEPQQQRQHLLALGLEIVDRRRPRAREIAHRLVSRIRHPHRRQFARPQLPRQIERIAPVGLHPIARLLRNERRRHHNAVVAKPLDQTIQAVAGRPGLVAQRQLGVLAGKLLHQPHDRGLRRLDLAEKPNLPRATLLRNRHRIAQLRGIQRHESFAIIPHDSPSLLEALPGQPGQPS